jgi:hypothetical protein
MNHTVDELFLAASLDDIWRTPLAIQAQVQDFGRGAEDCERPRALGGYANRKA